MAREPKLNDDNILAFMTEERTSEELERHFGLSMATIRKKLPKQIGKFMLRSFRNKSKQYIFYYKEKKFLDGELSPRIWTPIFPTDESGNIDDGAIIIDFPDVDWGAIKIVPLAEVHIGSMLLDVKKLASNIELITNNVNFFFIINGSIFGILPKGRIDEKIDFISETQEKVKALLAPVAHKILWAHQGCTEEKIEDATGADPLEEVCRELNILYFKRPVMAEILWGKSHFSLFCIHGDTNARLPGTMLNAVVNLLNQLEFTNFIVMSHQRCGMENEVARTIRDRTLGRLILKAQHLVITQGYLKYKGSREERKGRNLPIAGTCALILLPDGECGYSD